MIRSLLPYEWVALTPRHIYADIYTTYIRLYTTYIRIYTTYVRLTPRHIYADRTCSFALISICTTLRNCFKAESEGEREGELSSCAERETREGGRESERARETERARARETEKARATERERARERENERERERAIRD